MAKRILSFVWKFDNISATGILHRGQGSPLKVDKVPGTVELRCPYFQPGGQLESGL